MSTGDVASGKYERLDDLDILRHEGGLKPLKHRLVLVGADDGSTAAGEFGAGTAVAGGLDHFDIALAQLVKTAAQVEILVEKRADFMAAALVLGLVNAALRPLLVLLTLPVTLLSFGLFLFVINGLILGWCGAQLPDAPVIGDFKTFILIDGDLNSYLWLTRFATLYYFAFFAIIMPLVGLRETPQPIPATISEPVLGGDAEKG